MENIGNILEELYGVIEDRKLNPTPGAYTTYLFEKGQSKICKKLAEEATETIISVMNGDKTQITNEVSDLLYHLIVLLVSEGISWTEVADELRARREQ